jgi:hypothetical protein
MQKEFQFERFVEEWATIYHPMQHHPLHNKRFFMIDNWYALQSLIRGLEVLQTPSAVIETDLEGRLDDRFDRRRYTVYIIAQAAEQGNEKDALKAKRIAKEGLLALHRMLRAFKENDELLDAMPFPKGGYLDLLRSSIQNGSKMFQAIDLEVSYNTTGEILDGWYGTWFSFEDCATYNRCVDYNDYLPKDYDTEP